MYNLRKVTAVAVCLILLLQILPSAAFAADAGETFQFLLSVNGGGSVTAKVGDVVTVRVSLRQTDADKITMFAVQDSVMFSNEFFELVPDSVVGIGAVVCSVTPMSGNWNGYTSVAAGAFSSKLEGDTWANPVTMYTFKLKALRAGTSVILHRDHEMSTTTGLDVYESFATNATVIIKDGGDTLSFADVAVGAWYYDAVKFISTRGITVGDGDGNFNPQSNLTRAQLAVILYRIAQMPDTRGGAAFSDVDNGEWYYDAVKWASSKGIIAGSGGKFRPNDSVTREGFAVMLWHFADKPSADGDLAKFSDSESVSAWATDAVSWAVGTGVISGSDGKLLLPQGTATRAQAAQILYNYLG
jgi:hypothetical protein